MLFFVIKFAVVQLLAEEKTGQTFGGSNQGGDGILRTNVRINHEMLDKI